MNPLLSIVIPTRNRQKYCIAAIEDILSYDYSGFELCIQDNSDSAEIEEYVAKREYDSRLIYKRIPEQIASVFNIGNSLGLATGKYVIIIGDDDTILPSIFSSVEYMDQNNIDSLCPIPIVNYYWPEAHPIYKNGYLVIPKQGHQFTKMTDVSQKLELLFKRGIVRYLSYYLPKVYHGIVRRDILEKIKDKTGHYAGGLSPDIYTSVAISALVKNHHTCDFAVSIAGACSKSTTSQSINKGHRGELRDAPHFNLRGDYEWDSRVPDYYSVNTIWAESALKAADEMELTKLSKLFNSNYLSGYSLLDNRSIFKFAFKQTFKGNYSLKSLMRMTYVGFISVRFYIRYLVSLIRKKMNRNSVSIKIEGLEDIKSASIQIDKSISIESLDI